ncbi:hypothetical protein KEJ21_06500 [Candidatus Bathyarchaeota archaeon]|nr:hypothetical protein [Candidatus Bathyarchaeota archaeon]MBS7630362.1 hypothetical protein [Candidatus Bathyarchaeota archaeon]
MAVDFIPGAIAITASIIASAWLVIHGSTINASAEVEKRSTIWGVLLNVIGSFMLVLNIFFIILLVAGGEAEVIPTEAWRPLVGALTMIGAGFAAALCIMVAAKAGSEMLTQKPELSIWSLLFVALGEGLAIYGLIVAILMVSG